MYVSVSHLHRVLFLLSVTFVCSLKKIKPIIFAKRSSRGRFSKPFSRDPYVKMPQFTAEINMFTVLNKSGIVIYT